MSSFDLLKGPTPPPFFFFSYSSLHLTTAALIGCLLFLLPLDLLSFVVRMPPNSQAKRTAPTIKRKGTTSADAASLPSSSRAQTPVEDPPEKLNKPSRQPKPKYREAVTVESDETDEEVDIVDAKADPEHVALLKHLDTDMSAEEWKGAARGMVSQLSLLSGYIPFPIRDMLVQHTISPHLQKAKGYPDQLKTYVHTQFRTIATAYESNIGNLAIEFVDATTGGAQCRRDYETAVERMSPEQKILYTFPHLNDPKDVLCYKGKPGIQMNRVRLVAVMVRVLICLDTVPEAPKKTIGWLQHGQEGIFENGVMARILMDVTTYVKHKILPGAAMLSLGKVKLSGEEFWHNRFRLDTSILLPSVSTILVPQTKDRYVHHFAKRAALPTPWPAMESSGVSCQYYSLTAFTSPAIDPDHDQANDIGDGSAENPFTRQLNLRSGPLEEIELSQEEEEAAEFKSKTEEVDLDELARKHPNYIEILDSRTAGTVRRIAEESSMRLGASVAYNPFEGEGIDVYVRFLEMASSVLKKHQPELADKFAQSTHEGRMLICRTLHKDLVATHSEISCVMQDAIEKANAEYKAVKASYQQYKTSRDYLGTLQSNLNAIKANTERIKSKTSGTARTESLFDDDPICVGSFGPEDSDPEEILPKSKSGHTAPATGGTRGRTEQLKDSRQKAPPNHFKYNGHPRRPTEAHPNRQRLSPINVRDDYKPHHTPARFGNTQTPQRRSSTCLTSAENTNRAKPALSPTHPQADKTESDTSRSQGGIFSPVWPTNSSPSAPRPAQRQPTEIINDDEIDYSSPEATKPVTPAKRKIQATEPIEIDTSPHPSQRPANSVVSNQIRELHGFSMSSDNESAEMEVDEEYREAKRPCSNAKPFAGHIHGETELPDVSNEHHSDCDYRDDESVVKKSSSFRPTDAAKEDGA
ncbi:hypothetical protein BJ508DRAFT_312653 [Ascobolus immersus RN42]|uniref:Uncharacterized protein n=1 Tax=Ascobolus immersus RN42 TaxID=1160509 RepID=A0A3N4HLJ2_ASCIM|nr:hypothetical protein BJ508DRAFT_312653 [Ascobolus immersus RN42]